MNICIVVTRYPYKDNMVHVFVKKIVDEWAKNGHKCVVIAPMSRTKLLLNMESYAPEYEKQIIQDDIFVEVYRPRFISLPKLFVAGVSVSSYLEQNIIERTVKSIGIKFDAIYSHFFESGVKVWHYAHTNNIPFFIATGESVYRQLNKPCKSFTVNKLKNTLSGVVCVSSKNQRVASELGYINKEESIVLPNAANLGLFRRMDKTECRKELSLPSDNFIILCVGQFIERKGQTRILQAIDKLNNPNIKVIFIGKGELQFEHRSILYKGTAENSKLPLYLNAADIFVLPTQNEGCCNAIIEALACGCPIVSSDREFNHDVLNNDNAVLVDPDNIDEIAQSIDFLYNNKDARHTFAEKAYLTGKTLSIERRAENIIRFMQSQIEKKR